MTEQRKTPTTQPSQHDQGLRQQFEQELQQLQHAQRTPAGAQAFPSAMTIFAAVLDLLKEGGVKDQLFELWKKLRGGTTEPAPQPPAPPPEPVS